MKGSNIYFKLNDLPVQVKIQTLSGYLGHTIFVYSIQ